MAKNAIKQLQKGKNCAKVPKNDQKSLWYTKNILQLDPPLQCHPEVHPKCLLSTKKLARENQKMSKTAKKGWFCLSKCVFFRLFSNPSCWPVREVCSRPINFNRGFWFHGDMTETKPPLFRIFSKNFNIFTNQNMIGVIAPKLRILQSKCIKPTLKCTDWGPICTY